MQEHNLLSKYEQENKTFSPRFVYHIGAESGFFSEYNNMILAMVYCFQHKMKFSIYSKDANFKYDKGWDDYFIPFCDEYGGFLHSLFNRRTNDRFKNNTLKKLDIALTYLFRKSNLRILTTYDLWDYIRSQKISAPYRFSSIGLIGDLRYICQQFINMTWNYNEESKSTIRQLIDGIDLPADYIGFHIRGGDKFTEAKIQEINVYIRKAESLSNLKEAFVLTDDYTIIESLRKNYPMWTFYTLCQPDERGYYHNQFKKESPTVKKSRYLKLFASMDLLSNSSLFVGTFSSNPGMYLGMRMNPEKTYSIDIPDWQIW